MTQRTPPQAFTTQPARSIHVQRAADCWLVWLNGTPRTTNHTYLVLYDTGKIERVSETEGSIDVLLVRE